LRSFRRFLWVSVALFALGYVADVRAALPRWMQEVEESLMEAALFRMMPLAGTAAWYPRPPAESYRELSSLASKDAKNAEFYALRARQAELKLDPEAAEADWKQFAALASNKVAAQLALADFYHRRVRPADEIAALMAIGQMPASITERLEASADQQSWKAFERALAIQHAQAMPKAQFDSTFQSWIKRYPEESAGYTRYFEYLLAQKDFASAEKVVADFSKSFPQNEVFAIKAKALLNYRQGSIEQGLATYERAFQPLWPAELVQSYFELLRETRTLRAYLDESRKALNSNPDDLRALARVYYYYQQQGQMEAAQQILSEFRQKKEARKVAWNAQELFTLGRLSEGVHAYPEAARYYFALYNVDPTSMPDARARSLAALTAILLSAPEQNIRVGAGELSMYKEIATMDPGPGFLNGILSLILNSTSPAYRYSEQERRAIPYFNRARAAELLGMLDKSFPDHERRAELHVMLLDAYSHYGEDTAVVRHAKVFLASFPKASQRTRVSLTLADAYARTGDTQAEFAIYDAVLTELATQFQGVPLGHAVAFPSWETAANDGHQPGYQNMRMGASEEPRMGDCEDCGGAESVPARSEPNRAFSTAQENAPPRMEGPRSPEYARVLDRYLSRLTGKKELAQAISVLKRELDRNPNDPGLYERLASFLQQNQIGEEPEQVYRRAIGQFRDNNWYHKLARWYLREKRASDYERLTREVIAIFRGSELEQYFQGAGYGPSGIYERINQFAHERFPHNLTFVRNLLQVRRGTCGSVRCYPPEWVALIRQHWFADEGLRNEFFEYLTANGLLDKELAALPKVVTDAEWRELAAQNAAAVDLLSQAEVWRSHFEQAAPALGALAFQYPADTDKGRQASAVLRSLAYFDARNTDRAVAIEGNLLKFEPGDRETMARIGDIYADRERFEQAEPFWRKIAQVEPGNADGYLQAATVFWDYYRFNEALALIADARRKLQQPNSYAYEAGAIYEGKRDFNAAIHEYLDSALAGNQSGRARLLQLARRTALKNQIEQATASLVKGSNPQNDAIQLRMDILATQERADDVKSMLAELTARATSIEMLEYLERLADQKRFDDVKQHSLERQAELSTDPVRRLELRYALVRFYESRKQIDAAQRNVEALYSANPKSLGVVRATVDFYWRHKLPQRALDVLLTSAKAAHPILKTQLTFEAARKATEAKQFGVAKDLVSGLLKESPQNAEYIAAMADIFAQSGDDLGLRDFYVKAIEEAKAAPGMTRDELNTRVATLRRGLIPALTRLRDFAGAVDQYIEIINKFPEDEPLVAEAALYAEANGRRAQLVEFYVTTIATSPKDFRWPMVLARIHTNLEAFPQAIESYGKAIRIRPDRNDLRIARASLLERLLRFDDAVADYDKLYELNYRDQQWMLKVAETRARQGKSELVDKALRRALVESRPEDAVTHFEVARRLLEWNFLQPAREAIDKAVELAGDDLLVESKYQSGVRTYVNLMTRLRHHELALAKLEAARQNAAKASLQKQAAELQKQGASPAVLKALENRELFAARSAYASALRELGNAVDTYFTPEEKLAFAQSWAAKPTASIDDVREFLIPLGEAAVLPDLEVKWRMQVLSASNRDQYGMLDRLIELQKLRGRHDELGRQIEALVPSRQREMREYYLQRAAEAYQEGGNRAAELRLRRQLSANDRFFELLLAQAPQELTTHGFRGANYAIAHGAAELALRSTAAAGKTRTPLWNNAYSALVGLHFAEKRPAIDAAFRTALGSMLIRERLAVISDHPNELAGDIWFYYGGRYGEYLGSVIKQANAEDFLPAMLERSPSAASGYFDLAEYYADNGELPRSIAEYERALELAPGMVAARDRYAVMLWRSSRRADAIAQWKRVYQELRGQTETRSVPESFWQDFVTVTDHIATRRLVAELRPDMESAVNGYVRRNGVYRVHSILRGVHVALPPGERGSWLLRAAGEAPEPMQLLSSLINAAWVPEPQREPLFVRMLELKQAEFEKADGIAKQYAGEDLRSWQFLWMRQLIKLKNYTRAHAVLESVRADAEPGSWDHAIIPAELLIAAQSGAGVQGLLDRYRSAQTKPASEHLRAAARQLEELGNKDSAKRVMEFVYTQEIDSRAFSAGNFLGLAEIELQKEEFATANDLLRRMTLIVGAPFEHHGAAAILLSKYGRHAEAAGFWNELSSAVPWQMQHRTALAKARLAAGNAEENAREEMATVAGSTANPYALRAVAAEAMASSQSAMQLGSRELEILARQEPVNPSEADQPYFYAARLKAASQTQADSAIVKLLRGALEDRPRRSDARVQLFRAALAFKRTGFALSVLQPFMSGYAGRGELPDGVTEDEASADYAGERLASLPLKERPVIAKQVGLAYRQLDRKQQALEYLRLSLRTDKDAVRRKDTVKQIERVKADIRRESANQQRRPHVQEEFEQPNVVRPKLQAKPVPTTIAKPAPQRRTQ
jgi:cellulose synthase operon protein C